MNAGVNSRAVVCPTGVERYVGDALMRFAESDGLPLVFVATRLGSTGQVVASIVRPSSSLESIVFDEFRQFLVTESSVMKSKTVADYSLNVITGQDARRIT